MRIALAVPGLDADTLELALLRAGHRVVWRALDTDEVVGQLAEATPEVLLLADHPNVATSTVVGASDLLGVRSVLVTTGSALSAAARRLGVLEQLVARPGAPIDLAALEAGPLGATSHAAGRDGTGLSGDLSDGPGLLDGPGLRDEAGLPDGVGLSDDAAEHDDARPPSPQPSSPPTSTPVSPHTPPSRSRGSAARGDTIARLEIDPSSVAPRVIAVWGPAGAPGRTTIAIGLAAELAGRGLPVCLVDADTYGGAIAPALGLLDESPGFAAACRLAGSGSLTADELDRVAQRAPLGSTLRGTHGELRVLTGIGRPHRWPELSAERVTSVLEECRAWRPIVVVDTGFNLETDEELQQRPARTPTQRRDDRGAARGRRCRGRGHCGSARARTPAAHLPRPARRGSHDERARRRQPRAVERARARPSGPGASDARSLRRCERRRAHRRRSARSRRGPAHRPQCCRRRAPLGAAGRHREAGQRARGHRAARSGALPIRRRSRGAPARAQRLA
ncbi:MAG: CpaE family protein [Microcella pacifica]